MVKVKVKMQGIQSLQSTDKSYRVRAGQGFEHEVKRREAGDFVTETREGQVFDQEEAFFFKRRRKEFN